MLAYCTERVSAGRCRHAASARSGDERARTRGRPARRPAPHSVVADVELRRPRSGRRPRDEAAADPHALRCGERGRAHRSSAVGVGVEVQVEHVDLRRRGQDAQAGDPASAVRDGAGARRGTPASARAAASKRIAADATNGCSCTSVPPMRLRQTRASRDEVRGTGERGAGERADALVERHVDASRTARRSRHACAARRLRALPTGGRRPCACGCRASARVPRARRAPPTPAAGRRSRAPAARPAARRGAPAHAARSAAQRGALARRRAASRRAAARARRRATRAARGATSHASRTMRHASLARPDAQRDLLRHRAARHEHRGLACPAAAAIFASNASMSAPSP